MEYRSVELNVGVGCPVACAYCPQSAFVTSYNGSNVMNTKTAKCILDNATFPSHPIDVFISGFSEPLAFDVYPSLLRTLQDHHYTSKIVMFTTGYKVTSDDIKFMSSLPKLRLNIHVNEKNMRELQSKLDELVGSFQDRIVFRGVGDSESQFSTIADSILKLKAVFLFQNKISRAGLLNPGEIKRNGPISCCKVSTEKRPVVLPNGTAVICSNDFGCKMKIGNLLKQRWDELEFDKVAKLQKDANSGVPCFEGCHLANPIIPIL